MKTIILFGVALMIGVSVSAQGWVSAGGNSDGYAFNPYSMSKIPTNGDLATGGTVGLIRVPIHITPEDRWPGNPNCWCRVISEPGNIEAIPTYPNSSISEPNNSPNLDAMPGVRVAKYILENKKPY